jgi:hypothetical protein
MRTSRIFQLAALLLLTLLVVAGCGGGGDDDKGSDARKAQTSSEKSGDDGGGDAADIAAELEVTLEHMGDKSSGAGIPIPTDLRCTKSIPATCHANVTCPASDSTEEATCAWLATNADTIFAPPRTDEVCTEQYGGPETAQVTGTVDGDKVKATFSRTNGCEIARWEAAAPLWTREALAGRPGDDRSTSTAPTSSSAMCVAQDPDRPVASDNPPVPCEDTVVEPEVIDDPPEAFDR